MSVSAIASAASLTPPAPMKSQGVRAPRPVVTAPPFTPAAQRQANQINTGHQVQRGRVLNIVV